MTESHTITQEQAQQALARVIDPNTGHNLVAQKSIRQLLVQGNQVHCQIELGYPAQSQFDLFATQAREALLSAGARDVQVQVTSKIISHAVQRGVKLLSNVKNIIAVASGKGGVGKSTTAVNLALALAAEGAQVGMLDADIYGPSQPLLLGLDPKVVGRPESKDDKSIEPMMAYGIQASSMGFLVDADSPMVWRGPMVTQALEQLLRYTNWRELDYLVIDLPPGTGDVQLTLAQKIPVTGAVIVTTPQDLALLDARKGLKMFEKVGIPVLGVVENMALHQCTNCGHIEHIFGEGGGAAMAAQYNVPLLGSLPLAMQIRTDADAGKPTVAADPQGAVAELYKAIARKVAVAVAQSAKELSAKFPTIVVSKDT